MTDNEIIKALEEIIELMLCEGSLQRSATISNAIDLINRQKAEIKRLKNEKDNLIRTYAECQAEAVKEFAERLKDMSEHFWEEKENFVSEETIDNLVKEMVGEDK